MEVTGFELACSAIMSDLGQLTLSLSVRPLRSVIFVPEVESIAWQKLFRAALRIHTATWGGWGNLVLPVPEGDGADDELLWPVLDAFDADLLHGLLLTVADMEALAPDFYAVRFDAVKQAFEGTALSDVEDIVNELSTQRVGPAEFDGEFQKLLLERVAPLGGSVGMPTLLYDARDPPPWPLVDAEQLRPLRMMLRRYSSWPDDDLALIAAANHGELTDGLAKRLRDEGVDVRDSTTGQPWPMALQPVLETPMRQSRVHSICARRGRPRDP